MQIASALAQLRAAADAALNGFPSTHWTRLAGPGPRSLTLSPGGSFASLELEPGRDLVLRCRLRVPASLAGEPLEATLATLYPADLDWNGRPVFSEDGVPVAAGPSLFTVVPQLRTGNNGTLTLRLRIPRNQTYRWVTLRLTTPSLGARFERFDVAWAQLALAEALATTRLEKAAVARAANLVVGRSTTEQPAAHRAAATPALEGMAAALVPLAGKLRALRVHLIGHSHIDLNWLWTWPDTVNVVRRDFKSVLGLMDEFPQMTFSHSQAVTYELIRRHEPQLFAKVREHIRAGRWESLAMQWAEGDVNMASGEAQSRQFSEAVRYSREILGVAPVTFHAPDTFGHAGNLPQLIAAAGGRHYYHHRCNPGGANQWPAFWWQGDDGTRVLGLSTPGYNGGITAREIAEAILRARRHGHKVALHFHGVGDHGGGPSRQNLQALDRFQQLGLFPTVFCSTISRYTDELLAAKPKLPVHKGEMQAIFEGCYTTHADVKLANRHGENLLTTADTLAALADHDQRASLDAAWRKVLVHQFHDILDGSAIHEAYRMTNRDYASVRQVAGKVTSAALDVLESGIVAGKVAVTNPLGFERDEWVVVPDLKGKGAATLTGDHGHVAVGQYTATGLGFVARVPAFGTVGYQVERTTATPLPVTATYSPLDPRGDNVLSAAPKEAPYYLVETPAFRVFVRRDCGIITSLWDKRAKRELVGWGMRRPADYMDTARPDLALGVLQFTEEHPHSMTSWQIQEVHTEHSLLRGATTRIVEEGPARLVLEVRHKIRKSAIRQQIIFYRDLARIDFQTNLDWREPGNKQVGVPGLKVAFTAKLAGTRAWYETPFAAVERPADGQESVALRWADVGNNEYGFALLNDSKHGHDALGSRLRLTLVRSAYDPDRIADVGRHAIRYAFVPHHGDWRKAGIVRAAASFNQPLIARKVIGKKTGKSWRPQLTGSPNVQIACIKRAHTGKGAIVRLYESAGKPGRVTMTGKLWETNVLEDKQGRVSKTLTFRPWQVRTILVAG
jgi:alpha-mannosidase